MTIKGTIIAVTTQRLVIAKDTDGRLYIAREQWCAPSLPRRHQRVEVNQLHEVRPERVQPVWTIAEVTRSA